MKFDALGQRSLGDHMKMRLKGETKDVATIGDVLSGSSRSWPRFRSVATDVTFTSCLVVMAIAAT